MPDCTLGKECVNPSHVGTREDYFLALGGRRQMPEPSKTGTGIRLTKRDREFLRALRVTWE
jgi:hypothetical protein